MNNFEKYENKTEYPLRGKAKYPKPKISHYDSYSEHGVAMDAWENALNSYEPLRKELVTEHRAETQRLKNMFMLDLLTELDVVHLSKAKQDGIADYIRLAGDGDFNEMTNIAQDLSPLIDTLLV